MPSRNSRPETGPIFLGKFCAGRDPRPHPANARIQGPPVLVRAALAPPVHTGNSPLDPTAAKISFVDSWEKSLAETGFTRLEKMLRRARRVVVKTS